MRSLFEDIISLDKFIYAFFFSINVFKKAFKSEAAFRQEFYLSLLLIIIGFQIGETSIQKTFLILSIISLQLTELLNRVLESNSNIIIFNNSHLLKNAKTIGTTSIFIAIGGAFFTWIFILFI